MLHRLTCLLLIMVALPAAAQIYRYTDANGNTAFSNQPPDGVKAQVVELPPLNSVDPQKLPAPTAPPQTQASPTPLAEAYEKLELTDLPDGGALRANNGTFTIDRKSVV